jgi:hypothetical protein
MKRSNILLKQTLLSLILLGQLTSCDAPRTERRVAGSGSTNALFGTPVNNITTVDRTPTPTTTPTGGTVGNVTIPTEVSHCSWSQDGSTGFSRGSAHLSPTEDSTNEGAYTLCQSTSSETDVYLQMKNPITDNQICLIPTYHSASNSVYVGEPRCLFVRSNTSLYKISLVKNRAGFSQYPVTGVMMMRDKAYQYGAPFYQMILSPDAYIFCSQWLAQYGDPSYCVPFKSAGHYTYHQF